MNLRPVAVALLAVAAASACGSSDPGPVPRVAPPAGAATARPASVALLVGLRDPDATRRAFAAIAQRVLAAPTRDVELAAFVGPGLGLSVEAAREVDFHRPTWFLAMTGGASHHLILLPVSDAAAFWRAATRSMDVRARRGGFAVLASRSASTNRPEVLVAALDDTHVMIVDDPATFTAVGAYVAGELAVGRPAADLELRVFVENLVAGSSLDREQIVTAVLAHAAVAMVGPVAAKDAAATADVASSLRPWFEPLLGMREVAAQISLGPQDIEARFVIEPGDDAAARAIVLRQRPGPLVGAGELPADASLVWADRARADNGALVDLGLVVAGDDPSPIVQELRDLFDDQLTGDYTVALHPAAVGNGLGASAVAIVRDPAAAQAAILAFCRAHFTSVAGATRGQHVFEASLPPGPAQELARLVSPRPRIAIAFAGDRALVSAGAVPEPALAKMLDPATPRPTRLAAKRILAVHALGDQRTVGVGFASLVDLASEVVAVAPIDLRKQLGALAGQHDDGGVLLSWGLDAGGTRFEIAARIPVEHLARTFGPVSTVLARYRQNPSPPP